MRLADYIASLTVTQGAGAGEPFRVLPWQSRFLRGFERTDGDVALSIARGNDKTTLIAGIACATVDGPLMQRRAETVIVASSFMQARVAYEHVLAFLRERGHDLDDRKAWRLQDSQNAATVEHRATGARVRCIGSDPARAHGAGAGPDSRRRGRTVAGLDIGAYASRARDEHGKNRRLAVRRNRDPAGGCGRTGFRRCSMADAAYAQCARRPRG